MPRYHKLGKMPHKRHTTFRKEDGNIHYEELFGTTEPLTGHIDLVTIEDGKIWVWDYKPNAHKEKYADTQVYFQSLMLSKRTGIPLDKFRCGYFDWDRAYMFKPGSIETKELNSSLKNF